MIIPMMSNEIFVNSASIGDISSQIEALEYRLDFAKSVGNDTAVKKIEEEMESLKSSIEEQPPEVSNETEQEIPSGDNNDSDQEVQQVTERRTAISTILEDQMIHEDNQMEPVGEIINVFSQDLIDSSSVPDRRYSFEWKLHGQDDEDPGEYDDVEAPEELMLFAGTRRFYSQYPVPRTAGLWLCKFNVLPGDPGPTYCLINRSGVERRLLDSDMFVRSTSIPLSFDRERINLFRTDDLRLTNTRSLENSLHIWPEETIGGIVFSTSVGVIFRTEPVPLTGTTYNICSNEEMPSRPGVYEISYYHSFLNMLVSMDNLGNITREITHERHIYPETRRRLEQQGEQYDRNYHIFRIVPREDIPRYTLLNDWEPFIRVGENVESIVFNPYLTFARNILSPDQLPDVPGIYPVEFGNERLTLIVYPETNVSGENGRNKILLHSELDRGLISRMAIDIRNYHEGEDL